MASLPISIDFDHVNLPSTPNYYWVGPKGYCQSPRSEECPRFAMNLTQLSALWRRIIQQTPRIKEIYINPQRHEYSYIQYSRWLRFPDYIYVKLIALDEVNSSLIIYSRSKYGYGDLGVNKRRVMAWVAQLKKWGRVG